MKDAAENIKHEPGYTIEPYDEGHVLVVPKNGSMPSIIRIGSLNLPIVHADISPEKAPTRQSVLSKVTHSIVSRLNKGEH
jgi:hypothetical protein